MPLAQQLCPPPRGAGQRLGAGLGDAAWVLLAWRVSSAAGAGPWARLLSSAVRKEAWGGLLHPQQPGFLCRDNRGTRPWAPVPGLGGGTAGRLGYCPPPPGIRLQAPWWAGCPVTPCTPAGQAPSPFGRGGSPCRAAGGTQESCSVHYAPVPACYPVWLGRGVPCMISACPTASLQGCEAGGAQAWLPLGAVPPR